MNINNCNECTRLDNKCTYNLDCNNQLKNNNVQSPCPAPEQPILNCDPNKPCPVLIKKPKPDNLYKRQFPDKPCSNIPDYRGSFKVCGVYKSKTDKIKHNLKSYKSCKLSNNSLTPGKGCPKTFLRINIILN